MPLVSSTAIQRVEYDAKSMQLHIWFHESGGPYTYYGVPQHKYDAFLAAGSKGTYFNDHIRDQHSINR